jgi:thiamine biosynthesis lipoprotein
MNLRRNGRLVVLMFLTAAATATAVGGCARHATAPVAATRPAVQTPPTSTKSASALQRWEYSQLLMGVQVRLIVYSPAETAAKAACQAAFERVAQLEDVMSDYRPDSELMRLCARAGQGPVRVSEDLYRVLEYAQEVSRRSEGAFDVTVGPLVQLWRQARKSKILPAEAALAEARAKVGWQKVRLDPAARTVELTVPGMRLDLGGIAKGDAGDQAIRVLRDHGVRSALFEAGGDIVVSDPPPGADGWRVELPASESGAPAALTLANAAVSTSGDTIQYVEINGRRYSHVVDPRTGLGLSEHFISTVTAPRGLMSDPLSKVATILGPERGMKVLKTFAGVKAWVGKSR